MAVDAVVFPLTAKKFSGATLTHTNFQRGLNGAEVRNADWQDTLRRFNITEGIKTLVDQAIVETFYIACSGPVIGFLIRDRKDYKAAHAGVTLSTGVTQRGDTTAVTSNTVYQLQKSYSTSARTAKRTITRPESGTIVLYDGGGSVINPAGYSIDYTTGLVTFTSGQSAAPTWDGQFYVPVRFETDEIPWDIIKLKVSTDTGYGDMPQIVLVEVRE